MEGLGGLQCGPAYFFMLHCTLQIYVQYVGEGKPPLCGPAAALPLEKMAGADSVSLAPDHCKLTHDLASVFGLQGGDCECWFTLTAAVTKHEDIFNAKTQGHRIVKEEPEFLCAPFLLHFKGEAEDMVIFCFKHRAESAYFYGVSAPRS